MESSEREVQSSYVVTEVLANNMTISALRNREKQSRGCGSVKTTLARCLVIAVLLILVVLPTGCSHQRKRTSGPPLVVLIVDRTSTTKHIQKDLVTYASEALSEYAQEGQMHIVLVNLDQKPSMDVEQSGELTSDKMDSVIAHVKKIDDSAKGTDIIGAFDVAHDYYSYEKKKPKAFRILCFTDGLIESPPGQKFRPWSAFDKEKFAKAKASIGIYFLASSKQGTKANQIRHDVESATKGLDCIIEEEGQAKEDVRDGTFHLPGRAQ